LLTHYGFELGRDCELPHNAEAFLGEYYATPVWLNGFSLNC